MREIKFRAWDKKAKKMHRVSALFMGLRSGKAVSVELDGKPYFGGRVFLPTLMQYTGLKDKNGKEIYEGDIVTDGEIKGIVYWHDYMGYANIVGHLAWVVGDPQKPSDYIVLGSNGGHYSEGLWEILGNTYENPELLGEKK